MAFATFERLGSATRTVKFLLDEGILLPRGLHKGELMQAPPLHARILQILHNPRYAGAFVYGPTRGRPRRGGGVSQIKVDMADWRFNRVISTGSALRPTRSVSPPMPKPMNAAPCRSGSRRIRLAPGQSSRPLWRAHGHPPWRQGLPVRARQSRRPGGGCIACRTDDADDPRGHFGGAARA
ncbi:recombinase family protein [Mesorhizobium sp. C420B]|nr:recombinase family protein [Mesorhizobium sp. LSHC420B00]